MHRRLVLLASIASLAASCAPQPPAGPPTVVIFFTADSAQLDDSAVGLIRAAAETARANPASYVHVRGFAASDTGSGAFNAALSRTRALAVRDALVDRGVEPRRILMEWRGTTQYQDMPREARRVEITVGG